MPRQKDSARPHVRKGRKAKERRQLTAAERNLVRAIYEAARRAVMNERFPS